jgi:hypothetical protein
MNNYYIYVYLDSRKSGKFIYHDIEFDFEPFYVGKGINDRINKSMFDSLNKLKSNKVNKILSEGFEIISVKIFENLSEIEAFDLEISIINKIGKFISGKGPLTNISDGGSGGDNISNHPNYEVIIEKMCNSQSGEKNGFFGKKHSIETIKNLSNLGKERTGFKNPFYGKKHSDESKSLIAEKNRINNIGERNPFFGKQHKEETKDKIREHRIGKKLSDDTRLKISESLKKLDKSGQKNPMATLYQILSPNNDIIEIIGIISMRDFCKGKFNSNILLKTGNHNGYSLIKKVRINES